MKFEHFIITPFNLRKYPQVSSSFEEWELWTVERIKLFKEYCLPSLLNQKINNFQWLIYLDVATSDQLREQLSDLRQYSHIRLIYVDGFPDFMITYPQNVVAMCSVETKWVITSRLDNDDCLHREAIETIQKMFVPQNGYMVSLSSGLVYDINTKLMSHYYYPNSPFISLIENCKNIQGIFYQPNHCLWPCLNYSVREEILKSYFHIRSKATFMIKKVLWIQIYHQKNISNSFYRGVPVICTKKLVDFGISVENKRATVWSIFKYAKFSYWKKYLKVIIVRFIILK